MQQQIITIGEATYELRRVFQGSQSLSALVAERLAQNLPTAHPVDGERGHDV